MRRTQMPDCSCCREQGVIDKELIYYAAITTEVLQPWWHRGENEHLAEADKGTLQLGVSQPRNADC